MSGWRKYLTVVVVTFVMMGCISPAYMFWTFYSSNYEHSSPLTIDQIGKLGPVADWIGSSSIAFFTFASVILLYLAYITQKEELKLTRDELVETRKQMTDQNKNLSIQRFENTFFQLLSLYHEIVNSTCYDEQISLTYNPLNTHRGRAYFSFAYDRLHQLFHNENTPNVMYPSLSSCSDADLLRDVVVKFVLQQQNCLGHYFRHTFQILKFVDASNLEQEEKQFYADLLRAQLSSDEAGLIFYYLVCISTETIPLAIKYDLLANLNQTTLLKQDHWTYYAGEEQSQTLGRTG